MKTRGEQMLALRRARMTASPAILRGGFRIFFLGAAAWAVIALAVWLAALTDGLALPSAFDPLAWHRHEMLFGFVGAVVCGFVLTAIPNWTGRLPIAGAPLGALFALWAAGRMAVLWSASVGPGVAAALDVGFYLILTSLAAREVLAAKNRNLPIVALLLLFGFANALDHAAMLGMIDDDGLGWRAGLALVIMMISLIGGRVVPSFTRNWLTKRGVKDRLPGQPNRFDMITLAATAIALAAWVAAPEASFAGWLLLLAGALQAARLARWGGLRAAGDALVLILHVGYAWVPIGLALLGASTAGLPVPRSAAIHALTAGAMATMILAVMTRATLGHTGRELVASPLTVIIYVLVTAGAVLRVLAALGLVDYMLGLELAGGAWAGAFVLFLLVYGPILFAPRLGEGD